jgi:mRNA-degrading endonuclease RelE of RelBE toxin-antitoxin system
VPRRFRIELAPSAYASLRRIRDKKLRRRLVEAIDALEIDPENGAKILTGSLAGLLSVRAADERYRIVFRLDGTAVVVLLVGRRQAGRATDVYEVARALVNLIARDED